MCLNSEGIPILHLLWLEISLIGILLVHLCLFPIGKVLLSTIASEKVQCLSFVLGYAFITTYTLYLFEGYLLKMLVILV